MIGGWYVAAVDLATLRAKHAALSPVLTERSRRVWAATEAQAIGYGGITQVARATGIAASTIQRGLRELASGETLAGTRNRKAGGGRKRATDLDATLLRDLDALVEPTAPGDPDSPLRWTCLSARTLAVALEGLGHHISHTVVAELLHGLGYSLQGNAKTREGRQHVDRDAQFRYIAGRVRAAQRRRQPMISVDTKKKELVGDFKNTGRTWRPAKSPQRVRVHDFVIPATPTTGGKAIPYGVYDLHRNEGWVSVGIDHDTATFAVQSIRRWWQQMGRPAYRQAQSLLITADAGGSIPPGTSKWNKIEHRLFSHIAMNWRGTPLVDLATIVSLIGSTHSRSGLRVRSELDRGDYPGGVTVTDAQLATVHLERHRFHGDWNYTIHPATRKPDKSVVA